MCVGTFCLLAQNHMLTFSQALNDPVFCVIVIFCSANRLCTMDPYLSTVLPPLAVS